MRLGHTPQYTWITWIQPRLPIIKGGMWNGKREREWASQVCVCGALRSLWDPDSTQHPLRITFIAYTADQTHIRVFWQLSLHHVYNICNRLDFGMCRLLQTVHRGTTRGTCLSGFFRNSDSVLYETIQSDLILLTWHVHDFWSRFTLIMTTSA